MCYKTITNSIRLMAQDMPDCLLMSITPEKCYDEYPLIRILKNHAENLLENSFLLSLCKYTFLLIILTKTPNLIEVPVVHFCLTTYTKQDYRWHHTHRHDCCSHSRSPKASPLCGSSHPSHWRVGTSCLSLFHRCMTNHNLHSMYR